MGKLFGRNKNRTDDYQTPGDTSVSYLDPCTGCEVKLGNDFILTDEDMERLQWGETLSFMSSDNCVMTLKYLSTKTETTSGKVMTETTSGKVMTMTDTTRG